MIEFKGELHTIPVGAALVLKVDRPVDRDQAAHIKRYAEESLGGNVKVLVLGPGITAEAAVA